MSFGKNPHVAKAENAELKAREARDEYAREQAWREAARCWDRASARETEPKRRQLYSDKSEQAREQAEQKTEVSAAIATPVAADAPVSPPPPSTAVKPKTTLPN